MTDTLNLTAKEIFEARAWLKDCDWPDIDEEGIDDLSDGEVVRAVARHFEGGISGFIQAGAVSNHESQALQPDNTGMTNKPHTPG